VPYSNLPKNAATPVGRRVLHRPRAAPSALSNMECVYVLAKLNDPVPATQYTSFASGAGRVVFFPASAFRLPGQGALDPRSVRSLLHVPQGRASRAARGRSRSCEAHPPARKRRACAAKSERLGGRAVPTTLSRMLLQLPGARLRVWGRFFVVRYWNSARGDTSRSPRLPHQRRTQLSSNPPIRFPSDKSTLRSSSRSSRTSSR
jgi:hypothetical protein